MGDACEACWFTGLVAVVPKEFTFSLLLIPDLMECCVLLSYSRLCPLLLSPCPDTLILSLSISSLIEPVLVCPVHVHILTYLFVIFFFYCRFCPLLSPPCPTTLPLTFSILSLSKPVLACPAVFIFWHDLLCIFLVCFHTAILLLRLDIPS